MLETDHSNRSTSFSEPLTEGSSTPSSSQPSKGELKRKRKREKAAAKAVDPEKRPRTDGDTLGEAPPENLVIEIDPAPDKGKQKQADDEMIVDGETLGDFDAVFSAVPEEDEEEEIIFEMSTKVEKARQWVMSPEEGLTWPRAFYDNHEEPFYSVVGGAGAVQELIRTFPNPILVAAAGKWTSEKKRKLMERAIRYIFEDRNKEMQLGIRQLGERNAWTLLGLPSKEHVKRLVEQGAVYNTRDKQLVVFRAVRGTPNLTRAFLITSANRDYADTIKRYLEIEMYPNAQISLTTPGVRPGLDKGEILVVVANKGKEEAKKWTRPLHIPRLKGPDERITPRLEVRAAPHCFLCHSNHHTHEACPWKVSLGFEIDASFGDK